MARYARAALALASLLLGAPAAAATLTVLHDFSGGGGAMPDVLVLGPAGTLYGATEAGGGACTVVGIGCGVVFSLAPPAAGSGAWSYRVLHRFGGADGIAPAALLLGADGVLYGAANRGGRLSEAQGLGCGTVFAVMPPAGAASAWTARALHAFSCLGQGDRPATLVAGASGTLYGTTQYGGSRGCTASQQPEGSGCGVVYALTPPAQGTGAWTETVLHTFAGRAPDGQPDGGVPDALLLGADGSLYGTTYLGTGAASRSGMVFRLTPPSGGQGPWTETILHRFAGRPGDGALPTALIADGQGNLVGTTARGGQDGVDCGRHGCGTLFAVSPPASPGGAWTESLLYSIGRAIEGEPQGLAAGPDDAFCLFGGSYGGRAGSLYALAATAGGWSDVPLHRFGSGPDGSTPTALIAGPAGSGIYYGVTALGGTHDQGIVFALTP